MKIKRSKAVDLIVKTIYEGEDEDYSIWTVADRILALCESIMPPKDPVLHIRKWDKENDNK